MEHKINPDNHPIVSYVWELEDKVRKLRRELLRVRLISWLVVATSMIIGFVIGVLVSRWWYLT